MMRFTRTVLQSYNFRSFLRHYRGKTETAPMIKVISAKDDDCIKLTFQYNSQNLNLKAPKEEKARIILSRIKLMAALQRKKEEIRQAVVSKYTGGAQLQLETEEDIDVCLFHNELPFDENMTNAQVWSKYSFLKIGDVIYEVKLNYPSVVNLSLPNHLLAGCPIRPHFILECSNLHDCIFTWYHSLSEKEVAKLERKLLKCKNILFENEQYWLQIGEGFAYFTTADDIGRRLKVICTPKFKDICGNKFSAESQAEVEAGPQAFPFEERHAFTRKFTDNDSIRCTSYNILANVYVEKRRFPYASTKARDIYYRKQLILKELLGYNSDIICLQEVQERVFHHDLKQVLNVEGYDGFYMRKGGRRFEGLAVFYRRSKFRFINYHGILLNKIVKEKEIFINLLAKVSGNYRDMSKLLAQDTAFQAVLLEDKNSPDRTVLVANTHLYSNKDAPEVRLIQAALCSCYTENILKTEGTNSTALLFCGDFNSLPDSETYKFLTSGSFECCPSWKVQKTEQTGAGLDMTLTHNLCLSSACGTPEYTNYTEDFSGCLDYIFYSTDYLTVSEVVPMPSHEKVTEHIGLPSELFPSDHLALICTLKWCN